MKKCKHNFVHFIEEGKGSQCRCSHCGMDYIDLSFEETMEAIGKSSKIIKEKNILTDEEIKSLLWINQEPLIKKKEKKRWRAEKNKFYYSITDSIEINYNEENNHFIDNKRFKAHNYFKTKKEAEIMAKKIRKIFKG